MNKIKEFINLGSSRSINAKKNILQSFFIKIISVISGLLIVPITIKYIDNTQYGLWLTLSSFISWLSFFDIGFANGLRNKFTEYKAKGKHFLVKVYISTTYGFLALMFIFVWIVFLLINHKLDWTTILNAPLELKSELSIVAVIVISFFCVQIVLNTINTILLADQNPAKSALISTIGQLISLITIYFLTLTTDGSLIYLALAIGFGPLLVTILASIFFFNSCYKIYMPSIYLIKIKYAKSIMSLGTKFFFIQIAAIIVYQTTNILIANVSGPNNVTIYNIVFKYFSIVTMIFSIIITPFWSSFTDAKSFNDYEWMLKTYRKLYKIVILLIGVILIMVYVSDVVFEIWIGDLVKINFSITFTVAIYVSINLWNMLFSQLLNGLGKIKLQLYVSFIGTFINIPFSLFLGKQFGVIGVISSSIILSIFSAIYSPYQVKLLLNQKAKGIWNE